MRLLHLKISPRLDHDVPQRWHHVKISWDGERHTRYHRETSFPGDWGSPRGRLEHAISRVSVVDILLQYICIVLIDMNNNLGGDLHNN